MCRKITEFLFVFLLISYYTPKLLIFLPADYGPQLRGKEAAFLILKKYFQEFFEKGVILGVHFDTLCPNEEGTEKNRFSNSIFKDIMH